MAHNLQMMNTTVKIRGTYFCHTLSEGGLCDEAFVTTRQRHIRRSGIGIAVRLSYHSLTCRSVSHQEFL